MEKITKITIIPTQSDTQQFNSTTNATITTYQKSPITITDCFENITNTQQNNENNENNNDDNNNNDNNNNNNNNQQIQQTQNYNDSTPTITNLFKSITPTNNDNELNDSTLKNTIDHNGVVKEIQAPQKLLTPISTPPTTTISNNTNNTNTNNSNNNNIQTPTTPPPPSNTTTPGIEQTKSPTMVSQSNTPNSTPCPYDHLVILVHGIGKHEKDWIKTIKRINKLFCKIFYNMESENFDKRVKFIGTEWHSSIHNHLGTTIQDVTPTVGIPAVRQIVDDTLLDFLMWSTPTFAEPIYKEVTEQLNQAYHGFIKEYPNFCGRVSILSHSLGSIITYDILTNQPNTVSDNLKTHLNSNGQVPVSDIDSTVSGESINSSGGGSSNVTPVCPFEEPGNISLWRKIKNYTDDKREVFLTNMTFTPLDFPVYNFYIIGSPVGALLSLRKHQQVPIPQCTNMYNIYNTCDPIAYLIEPLIDKRFLQSDIEYLPRFTRKLSKLPKKFKKSKKIEKMIANTPNTHHSSSANPSPCLISAQQQQQQIQQQIQQISISSPNYGSVTTTASSSSSTTTTINVNTLSDTTSSSTSSATSSSTTSNLLSVNDKNSNSNSLDDEEDEEDSSSGDEDQDDDDSSSNDNTQGSGSISAVDEDQESKLTRSKANINLFGGFRYDYALKPKGFHISEYGPMLTAHSSYWLSKEVLHFIGAKLLV